MLVLLTTIFVQVLTFMYFTPKVTVTGIFLIDTTPSLKWNFLEGVHKMFKIKLGVTEGTLFTLSYIVYFHVAYDTTSLVPKQSCLKKLNIVPFLLIINHKPVIACYLLQYGISSSFHISSLFLSIRCSKNVIAKQT